MKLFRFFLLLIVLFTFFSCSDLFDGKDGVKTVYFPESKIVQQVVEYERGKKNGIAKEFYRNGKLKNLQHFINDTLVDSSFFYHKNGNLYAIQLYLKNKKEGCWKYYNTEGKLHKENCYKNDVLDGTSCEYTYRTGRLLIRFNFKEGSRDGKQEVYYNNGKPKYIVYYDGGKPCLGTEEWYESGEKVNNDFKINIIEDNKVQLENSLKYYIELENPQQDDCVFAVVNSDTGRVVNKRYPITQIGNRFFLDYMVGKGHFIMETVKLAAFRKTKMGNTVIKTISINVAAENY